MPFWCSPGTAPYDAPDRQPETKHVRDSKMTVEQPAATSPAGTARPSSARILRLMLTQRIAVSALKVSLVVGTVLNLINNGEQWWTHHTVNLWQALLNYLVPFGVSSYSAARNEAQRPPGT
jgi:hypothetical protein